MSRATARTGWLLSGVAALMLGASFAAVPFYDWFCRVTGYGGTPQVGELQDKVLDQTITIRFDGSHDPGLPWDFAPLQTEMTVNIGQSALAFYRATNTSDETVAGQAAYNVAPDLAGQYFIKVECFCFTEQVLAPGESIDMPVSFYVDPAMMDDPETSGYREVTLSYTFFRIPLPDQQAGLSPGLDPGAGTKTN